MMSVDSPSIQPNSVPSLMTTGGQLLGGGGIVSQAPNQRPQIEFNHAINYVNKIKVASLIICFCATELEEI